MSTLPPPVISDLSCLAKSSNTCCLEAEVILRGCILWYSLLTLFHRENIKKIIGPSISYYVNFLIGLKLGKFTKESRRILEWLLCYIASIFSQISISSTLSIKYSQRSGIVSRCHTFLWTAQVVFIPDQRWECFWDSVTTTGQRMYSKGIWDEHPRYNKGPTPNWEYIILKNLYNISI